MTTSDNLLVEAPANHTETVVTQEVKPNDIQVIVKIGNCNLPESPLTLGLSASQMCASRYTFVNNQYE